MPAPRRRPHHTRKEHQRQLAWCFVAAVVLMLILGGVSWVFGQAGADHPFPFKTLEELTAGTLAWVSQGPLEVRRCPGTDAMVGKLQFESNAKSVWVVYTDGTLFAAAYFAPGAPGPVTVVLGSIINGNIVVASNVPFNGTQRPCDQWQQKSAMEG